MHDPLVVGVLERRRHPPPQLHRLVHRQLLLPVQRLPQALPLDVRHDVEEEAVRFTRIEQGQDVGMLEVRRGPDLREEPLPAHHGGQLRLQHLERHLPAVLQVLRQVDRGHATLTELALDPVAALQGAVQALDHGLRRARAHRPSPNRADSSVVQSSIISQ
ncbi:MAG: hypothetical protein P8177_12345 [Gemmatimonadota bacterium]